VASPDFISGWTGGVDEAGGESATEPPAGGTGGVGIGGVLHTTACTEGVRRGDTSTARVRGGVTRTRRRGDAGGVVVAVHGVACTTAVGMHAGAHNDPRSVGGVRGGRGVAGDSTAFGVSCPVGAHILRGVRGRP